MKYYRENIKKLTVIFTSLLMLFVFADGANIDDLIAKTVIIHTDTPDYDDVSYCISSTHSDSGCQEISRTEKGSISVRHYIYDQDSPALDAALSHITALFIHNNTQNQISKYSHSNIKHLYLLNCTLLI